MTNIVHISRLDWGVFSGREGDIAAAYSAPALSSSSDGKGINTFRYDGKLWTVGGRCGSWLRETADAYELIAVADYNGPDNASYSYEGKTITHRGRQYRLGPKTEFIAADRTVAEWCIHLRQTYENGGYFTSGKTYHDLLREDLEREIWDSVKRAYVKPSGNIVAAIRLELAKPNFDKHKFELIKLNRQCSIESSAIDITQLPALMVAVRKDWRRCFR